MDDFGISDDTVTVGADMPSFDDSWLTGFNPTLENVGVDPIMDPVGVDDVSVGGQEQAAIGGASGGGGIGGSIASIISALGGGRGLLSDASGLAGLLAAHGLSGLANQITRESNPFGAYRDQYAKQLQTLMADPSSVASDPGFTSSRDQALKQTEKNMAAQGYKGSGNMGAALYDRANNFQLDYVNNKENQLAQLAGAGITPNYSGAVSATEGAAGLESSGLAALGAGLGYASPAVNVLGGGASAGTPASATRGGFNSAGGEAATAISLANSAINLTNSGYNLASGGNGGVISKANGTVGGTIGEAALGLGIYNGIKQGGVAGYAGAATDAAMLGAKTGLVSSGVGAAAGYVAAPLALYNFGKNWKSGSTGSDALSGASTGAAIGSVVPVVGTALGAVIGGAVGALSSLAGPGKKDPETQIWDSYLPAVSKNPDIAKSVDNPFIMMAGLFDERSSTLPMYQKYGRMGENKFTVDMTQQINQGLASGTISKTDDPSTVYSKVVAPWVASMGKGWSGVGAEYTKATQGLLQQMTAQYMNGSYQKNWKAIGGDYAFSGGSQGTIQPYGATSTTPAAMPATQKTTQPIGTGQIMQGLAMGISNNFRGLQRA
jgi:hypothetical protein